ncbi:MAG TPA: S-adenosylmethionine:tRNA ribosyltransferase-isomerase [Gemmatimonadaceae bacterium]|nr:S-adenosylmethionine:tRNA ribosyltransferase-isomerase [Gemmatimonadaceae bacterium]
MTGIATLDWTLPDELAAREPPEARGMERDDVRLLVSRVAAGELAHARFVDLPEQLAPGDLIVVNTSATINAAFDAGLVSSRGGERPIVLHLSAPLADDRWVVELRHSSGKGTAPLLDAAPGDQVRLPGGARAWLMEPYTGDTRAASRRGVRLWLARVALPTDTLAYCAAFGRPIRYDYVPAVWPLSAYQTMFSSEPGSAEMPSAGRAFTGRTLDALVRRGVRLATITLHTGVSSLDADERPYPERYRVSSRTANAVNHARAAGARVIAVGTTVVRALETAAAGDEEGSVHASAGWTDLVVTPQSGVRVADGLLTGFHAPHASHLAMLEAFAGREQLERAYEAALEQRYLWHEFGDLHLILR